MCPLHHYIRKGPRMPDNTNNGSRQAENAAQAASVRRKTAAGAKSLLKRYSKASRFVAGTGRLKWQTVVLRTVGPLIAFMLIVSLVSLIPSLISNSILHQSDPETLSDGQSITYFGGLHDDTAVFSSNTNRALMTTRKAIADADSLARAAISESSIAKIYSLDWSRGEPPSLEHEAEEALILFAAYSVGVQNGHSDNAFLLYQTTSAIKDYENKLNQLASKPCNSGVYGNQLVSYDFLRNEDGSLHIETVGEGESRTQYIFPIVQPLSVSQIAEEAFLPDGKNMTSPLEEYSDEFLSSMGGTYGEMTLSMASALGEILYGDAFNSDGAFIWTDIAPGGVGGTRDTNIVNIARSQVGNVGGEPYWRYMGYKSRVEWCACFVSWCAYQSGHIDDGSICKYASCQRGLQWFRSRGQFGSRSYYTPVAGDIIFFDNNHDGRSDHTGIVAGTQDGRVYTIEGNCQHYPDGRICRPGCCKECSYPLSYTGIIGYGIPKYPASSTTKGDISQKSTSR